MHAEGSEAKGHGFKCKAGYLWATDRWWCKFYQISH